MKDLLRRYVEFLKETKTPLIVSCGVVVLAVALGQWSLIAHSKVVLALMFITVPFAGLYLTAAMFLGGIMLLGMLCLFIKGLFARWL